MVTPCSKESVPDHAMPLLILEFIKDFIAFL